MKVIIKQPTRHDGRHYAVGDTPDLPKTAALTLIACGSAEAAGRAASQDASSAQDASSNPAGQSDAPVDQG